MTKTARKEKNQRIAMQMKADRIERTTGRCPICNRIIYADYLAGGMSAHVTRCNSSSRRAV
jgi:hypothetical protein